MRRENFTSGTQWEPIVGYSRAVKVGDRILVSGTTATDAEGNVVSIGDAHGQMVQCILNVRTALNKAGARLEHVIRTRIYVTNIEDWEKVGRAHAEYFGKFRPASTMVQVAGLIDPKMLVELEVEALLSVD